MAENVSEDEKSVDANSGDCENVTFRSLGVVDVLCEACEQLNWKIPTPVQREAIPVALSGKDIIGLAETGSGKTGAFALPILQALLEKPQYLFALVLTPTRELAFQISEHFEALGSSIGLKTVVIVGGIDIAMQWRKLSKKAHIIVATPGRLVDHLQSTKGFNLKSLKYLVLDEADRILDMNFKAEVDIILKAVPQERKTYLYSATMTEKVQQLLRVSLNDPVKIKVSQKYQTVQKLQQYYIFIPMIYKDIYLVHLLNKLSGYSVIVFVSSCAKTQKTALMLRNLGFTAIQLHGRMRQTKRIGALAKFKSTTRSVLVATDVLSRGLDILNLDVVINFDLPKFPDHFEDYIHRVGRTARAGRGGKAITFVTQYDVVNYLRLENLLKQKLLLYPTEEEEVLKLKESVTEAQNYARKRIKELEDKRKGKKRKRGDNEDNNDDDDDCADGYLDKKKRKGVKYSVKKKKFKKK